MSNIKLLDCTLRDGGYIVDWNFGRENIVKVIDGLKRANLDYIEIGYLNERVKDADKSIFQTIEEASQVIPQDRGKAIYLAMADVDQFSPENIVPYQPGFIDGIRVVFYKHQVEKAILLCEAIKQAGYKLLVQPMVTIDYTIGEYSRLIDRILQLSPYAVAIVDSYGYMSKVELKKYFDILNTRLTDDIVIGFHSHNNMQFSVLNAESMFAFDTTRNIIIDSSIYGMGRGAGNLNTELIANYYNENISYKYNLGLIINLISDIIYPIYQQSSWGYSPYYYLTALYHCHPNYAAYLLEERTVSVNEFEEYLKKLPQEMRTKCRKPYVIESFDEFMKY